jgi:hypothetical protein
MSAEVDFLPLSVEVRDGCWTGLFGSQWNRSVCRMSQEDCWNRDVVDGSFHAEEGEVCKNAGGAAYACWVKIIAADYRHGLELIASMTSQ